MSTYSPIASQTLTSNTASITFSNLPTNYTDLVLVINAISSSSTSNLRLRFNGDTGSNYSSTFMYGFGSSTYSDNQANETYIIIGAMYNTRSNHIINLQDYNNSNTFKTTVTRSGAAAEGTGALVGMWRNTSPITSINITDAQGFTVGAGSIFSLYGIASGSAKATGGTVTTDGTYFYHTFTSSGVFTPSATLTADVLRIAGGGGSGFSWGAGGGAGGLLYSPSQSLSATSYAVTIGAGGAAGISNTVAPAAFNGNDTTFTGLANATGGGAGRSGSDGGIGYTGGCGGGSNNNATGGTGTQGFNGGTATSGSSGGGGMGAAGANSSGSAGVNGGNGLSTYSSWGAATGTGENVSGTYWYAGGGGSGGNECNTSGLGGNGGGGDGGLGSNEVGFPGQANTGGGGGGGRNCGVAIQGGAGGSGLVIVRYAV